MKNSISIIVLLTITLASCASTGTLREQMLPNGHWVIGLSDNDACYELIKNQKEIDEKQRREALLKNVDKLTLAQRIKYRFSGELPLAPFNNKGVEEKNAKLCVEKFQESITGRASELCGNHNFLLYGCLNSKNDSRSGFSLDPIEGDYSLKCYLNCNPVSSEKNPSGQK